MNVRQIVALVLFLGIAAAGLAEEITPDEEKFFETKIRPVLIRECYGCHSNQSGNARGGLRLDTRELMRIGGGAGPAVVPGNLEESWLYNAITHQDFVMPPKRKLPQNVISDFKAWIEMGAPDPRTSKVAEIKASITPEDIQREKASFWAYQKPTQQDPPSVKDSRWPRTDIDRFVLAKLEASGLQAAEDAESHQVLRRLCFDLIGLPPTPEQIDYFATKWKTSPDQAIAHVVDRLLEKEQFGERWGRHWLDVARYAESTGREVNMTYPHAWRYRDYVIDSFNADKPFNRFVQEQIAGDLLPVETDEQWAENLIATTFLALGAKNLNEQNRVQFAADVVDEQIDATTRVFLGTSVACARCHDHKFDPIPQTDYYALAGVFRNMTTYFGNPPSEFGRFSGAQLKQSSSLLLLPIDDPNSFDKRYTTEELAALRSQIREKLGEMASLRRNRRAASDGNAQSAQRERIRLLNELASLSGKLAVVDESGLPQTYCMGVQESGSPDDARLLVRGEIDQAGPIVSRGFPKVLCSTTMEIDRESSGRLELARWIGSDENPLTARVMVNRIWQHMFGQGIVTSTENFGSTGQPPSHPELLDYLAVQFVESSWSVKALIREIATSRAYRMQSTFNEEFFERDPDNKLLWRANPRRLDAEALRDAMLAISGQIDLERPRASEVAKAGFVRVRNGMLQDPREMLAARRNAARLGRRPGFGASGPGLGFARPVSNPLDMEDAKFRSVYLPIVRDEEPRSLVVFDFADTSAIIGKREASNTANQALYMMNNRFVIQQSGALARRVATTRSDPGEQIELAFVLTYGRPPTSSERAAAVAFAEEFSPNSNNRPPGLRTLSALCQSLFASAEFRYLD